MGIKERQERDREAVRRAILDAARDLFVKEGFENVTIRKIAEIVEYSPAALYGYFRSKDDIFWALADDGFRLLYGTPPDRSALAAKEPLERVRAVFRRLYAFSVQHPEYFALMFVDRSVPRISREYERFPFAREMKDDLLSYVRAAVAAGTLPATVAPDVIFRMLSSAVIGVAVMRLSDRLTNGEDAEALAHDLLDLTIAGLQAGVPIRSSSVACLLEEVPGTQDAHVS